MSNQKFPLRIISWNVNGIRAIERKGNLKNLLTEKKPDILFLQEIKAHPEQLSPFLTENSHYFTSYNPAEKKGYAGTGIWFKKNLFSEFSFAKGMGGKDQDEEGRVLTLTTKINNQQIALISTYMPNGGKSEKAWKDKLVFYRDFLNYTNKLHQKGYQIIWGGDVNCAHQAIDLARPKDNEGKIGFHPLERKALDEFIANNWVDIWRHFYPEKTGVYSWWHLVTRARSRNIGWRIDYFFCHQSLLTKVKSLDYLMDYQGSDHCPVLLTVDY